MNPGIRLQDYSIADDPAARELERRCPQGETFRIIFERQSFHSRTEFFSTAQLLCAFRGNVMIGIGGGAIKDVCWRGERTKALLLYDFRVDPMHRREGIARLIAEALLDWARTRAEIGYAYALGDNYAIQTMAKQWIGADASPAFVLLTHPTHRQPPEDWRLKCVSPQENHLQYRSFRGDVMFDCADDRALVEPAVVGAWNLEGESAGCAAWSSRGILEEVVVGLPPTLRLASWLLGGHLGRRLRLPHAPRIGETLRSWIVIDGHAASPPAARRLFGAVAARAREEGVDYCHILATPDTHWLDAVRAGLPPAFAPQIPFAIMARTIAGRPLRLDSPLVDPRDI